MCLGIPGQIIEVREGGQFGVASILGVKREVNLSCVYTPEQPESDVIGSWALIHVGFAMSLIDEDEAQRTLEILKEIGELQEEMDAMAQSGSRA